MASEVDMGNSGSEIGTAETVLVDGHVHVHRGVDVAALLEWAARNFADVAANEGLRSWRGVLMLADMGGFSWFDEARSGRSGAGSWTVSVLEDALSVLVRCDVDGAELILIKGRQIVTAEGIEVLGLAMGREIEDGSSLSETLAAVAAGGGLAVLPWGAGKWLGRRGQLVSRIIREARSPVFAGDNGGRPFFWPEPRAFELARTHGRPVLSGTDPLPLPREERRVGAFGFRVDGLRLGASPALTLRQHLPSLSPAQVRPFGRLQGGARFLGNQAALRLRKRSH